MTTDLHIANDEHSEKEIAVDPIITDEAVRSDADEIQWRFAKSSERLRELRAEKQVLFDAIRDEVIANNRLARAAKIYNIELEGDDGQG